MQAIDKEIDSIVWDLLEFVYERMSEVDITEETALAIVASKLYEIQDYKYQQVRTFADIRNKVMNKKVDFETYVDNMDDRELRLACCEAINSIGAVDKRALLKEVLGRFEAYFNEQ